MELCDCHEYRESQMEFQYFRDVPYSHIEFYDFHDFLDSLAEFYDFHILIILIY